MRRHWWASPETGFRILLWLVSALTALGALYFYGDRRRHRRNAAGQCAFCRSELSDFEHRVEGVWVCARCARRTKRSAYAALILVVGLAGMSVVLGAVGIARNLLLGVAPSLWNLGMVLLAPAGLIGCWWGVVKEMQGDNRAAERFDTADAMAFVERLPDREANSGETSD